MEMQISFGLRTAAEAGNQNLTIRTLAKIAATLHPALMIHLRHAHGGN